jgi:hypothetical protein
MTINGEIIFLIRTSFFFFTPFFETIGLSDNPIAHVSTIAPSVTDHPIRISPTFLNAEINPGHTIVVIPDTPLSEISVNKLLAVICASPEVRLENHKTIASKKLIGCIK